MSRACCRPRLSLPVRRYRDSRLQIHPAYTAQPDAVRIWAPPGRYRHQPETLPAPAQKSHCDSSSSHLLGALLAHSSKRIPRAHGQNQVVFLTRPGAAVETVGGVQPDEVSIALLGRVSPLVAVLAPARQNQVVFLTRPGAAVETV